MTTMMFTPIPPLCATNESVTITLDVPVRLAGTVSVSPRGVEEVWLSVLRSASGIKAETQQDAAPQAQQRSDSSS